MDWIERVKKARAIAEQIREKQVAFKDAMDADRGSWYAAPLGITAWPADGPSPHPGIDRVTLDPAMYEFHRDEASGPLYVRRRPTLRDADGYRPARINMTFADGVR